MTRYEIQHTSGTGKMRVERRNHYTDAAKAAVQLARAGCTPVTVLRFDPATGWDIVGVVRVFVPADRERERVILYDDLRTAGQRAADTASEQAPARGELDGHTRGHLSRMFVALPALRPVRAAG